MIRNHIWLITSVYVDFSVQIYSFVSLIRLEPLPTFSETAVTVSHPDASSGILGQFSGL